MDNRNMSYVRKDSAMGKAALNAAGYTGRPFGTGVLFTYDGRSYRVLADTLDGLQSYMGYEDITGKESLHSQEVGRIPRKPLGGVIVIHDFAGYMKRLRIASERGYRNPEKWAALASNGIAMDTGDFERDHQPEPVAEARNATRPVNLSDILAAALVAEVQNCGCGDNDGLWCSLHGCPYPKPSAALIAKAQNCDCGHCSPDPDFAEVEGSAEIAAHSYATELNEVLQAVAEEGFDIKDGAAASVFDAFKALRADIAAAASTVATLTRERDLARRDVKVHAEIAESAKDRAMTFENTIDRMYKAVKAEFDKSDILPF